MATLAEILKKARRAVMRQGISDQDADELVHEAYLKVDQYQQQHAVQSHEALLVRAAVNLSIDRQRRSRHMPLSDGAEIHQIVDAAPDPARIVEARARLRQAAAGLERLPERTRRILLKRRLENMSYAEIAASEDMSVAAVEKLVARATLQLMNWMAQS
ncbi:MAG: RNA polymerase sigma factor [Alphaproteobacteria bacterium]|nr:RNA polymerase sigma factor [Alphaproteobacteria bacterium]MBU2271679.1 RNA polymerase sigma factor [Alphaproteobacteria bacterium]MBU2417805.1 RNA polymerase sigma factor [Alphaproteobacteria bacterium]